MTKLLLLLAVALAIVASSFLYLSGFPFEMSVLIGGMMAFALLASIDYASAGINIFRPLGDRIIANWRQAWRWISVQMMALAGVLQLVGLTLEKAWLQVPPSITATVSPATIQTISLVVLLMGLAGRFLNQTKTSET